MIDQLLELELGLIKARLDARKVLPKKSGKRPGKFCKGKSGKGSYIAAEKKCADHETTTPDGKRKLSESGKRSAEELAKKVRERKGMKGRVKPTPKGLPDLQGSEKQVAWASKLRDDATSWLKRQKSRPGNLFDEGFTEKDKAAALERASKRVKASWWIDRQRDVKNGNIWEQV